MSRGKPTAVWCPVAALFAIALLTSQTKADDQASGYRTHSLRGQVVWLAEALKAQGIEVDADAGQSLAVLQTSDGQVVPIVKDSRGRGFWLDEQLRHIDVELLVRQHTGSPWVQVIRVIRVLPDGRYELDYWCDICAIPMFELKPCECCQGKTRLRLRKLDEHGEPLPE